jgi:large subunit ribosomal protein L31e
MAAEARKAVLEREYILNIREYVDRVPEYKRTERAVTAIRDFLIRHMKVYDKDKKKIKISKWLNEYLWKRSIKNPPTRIKIKAIKYDDGFVEAELAELSKKAQLEKDKEKVRKVEAEKAEAQRTEQAKQQEEAAKAAQAEAAEEKREEKERADELKKEEKLLEKDIESKHREKGVAKPRKEQHKKRVTGI